MSVLFYGIVFLAAAFLIHILIWKIRQPMHQKSILLLSSGVVLIGGIILLIVFGKSIRIIGIIPPNIIYEYIQLSILFISVSLAYIVTYSALEADSPSFVMVMTIAQAGKNGLEDNLFTQKVNNEILLMPRIQDLISEKLAYLEEGRYILTPKGLKFALIFYKFRKLLKRPQKGG